MLTEQLLIWEKSAPLRKPSEFYCAEINTCEQGLWRAVNRPSPAGMALHPDFRGGMRDRPGWKVKFYQVEKNQQPIHDFAQSVTSIRKHCIGHRVLCRELQDKTYMCCAL